MGYINFHTYTKIWCVKYVLFLYLNLPCTPHKILAGCTERVCCVALLHVWIENDLDMLQAVNM